MTRQAKKQVYGQSSRTIPEIVAANVLADLSNGEVPWNRPLGLCPVYLDGRLMRGLNRLALAGTRGSMIWASMPSLKHYGVKVKKGHSGTPIVQYRGGKPTLGKVWSIDDTDSRLSDWYLEMAEAHREWRRSMVESVQLPPHLYCLRACYQVDNGEPIDDPKIFQTLVRELARGFLISDGQNTDFSVLTMPAGLWEAYLNEKPYRLLLAANKAQRFADDWIASGGNLLNR